MLVWDRIQQDYQNPFMEAMSRFAQIGFMAVLLAKEEQEATK